jgi:hypothetical protein
MDDISVSGQHPVDPYGKADMRGVIILISEVAAAYPKQRTSSRALTYSLPRRRVFPRTNLEIVTVRAFTAG